MHRPGEIVLPELHVHDPMVWRSWGLDHHIEVGLPLRSGLYLETMASWLFHSSGAIITQQALDTRVGKMWRAERWTSCI
jgi:hypothetical protein